MACQDLRQSGALSPSLQQTPLPTIPVPSQLLSFSITKILGLEDKEHRRESGLSEHALSPRTCNLVSYARSSPPYSDDRNSGSDGDFGSEDEPVRAVHVEPPSKKRQRTTFSPIEVRELERAFKRRPYPTAEDEEELVQRLGIAPKSLKYWFQNRRAKLKKEEGKLSPIYRQTNPSNLMLRPVYSGHCARPQQAVHFPSDQFRMQDRASPIAGPPPFHKQASTASIYSSFKSVQFRRRPVILVSRPVLRIVPTEPARIQFSRSFCRYQPY